MCLSACVYMPGCTYMTTSRRWGGVESVTWPAQSLDCLDAVSYVYNHFSELGIDRTRMACWGGSAGGHLCAITAILGPEFSNSTKLSAAAVYYPPTNILKLYSDINKTIGIDRPVLQANSFESILLGSPRTHISLGEIIDNLHNTTFPWPYYANQARSVDPETWITNATPPVLIAHGTMDHTVPFKQGVRLADALTAAKRPNEFIAARGCDHAGEPRSCWHETFTKTAEWLAKMLHTN